MARGLYLSSSHFILILLASSLQVFQTLVYSADNHTRSSFTQINRHLYHSSVDLMEEIKGFVHRHPDKLSIETFKTENKGYKAEITVVTYSRNRREIDDRSKFRILLSFGQHGRELITSELALRILSVLSEEKFLPKMDHAILRDTLDRLLVKIIPMENLNGRKLVEAGDLCERRNGNSVTFVLSYSDFTFIWKDIGLLGLFSVAGRGVDLNRNWSVDWGKKEKDYDPYEENPGISPFSEPETQIMRKLSKSFEPHMWVNVHSGMEVTANSVDEIYKFVGPDRSSNSCLDEALFMPYDHKNTTPDGLPSQKMRLMLENLNHLHCHDRCMIGSGGGSVGYLAHGTATDYMYDIVGVPMAFTFEIYGDGTASSRDCFKMFNPTDQKTYTRVLDDWSAAFFSLFKLGPNQLKEIHSMPAVNIEKLVSIDAYLEGYLMARSSRYGKKTEVLDLGMQEIRTYFRLFLLSSVLLMFMFCTRISKSQCSRPNISTMPL
ncbi:Peptidase M14, carboxypeptidase A [Dillenia turbinata]|uniref:Peptidase M14, carboxypeptidase A n=1 Tax=Dillenia turbinata TaxID=194707 RepID=A0AAN8W340_9MAGN